MSVEWLCARCASKESKETEPDPVCLRLCTSCKVENYVRPFGHGGEAVEATPEEIEAALVFHEQKMKVLKKATEIRKEKEAEDYKEAEEAVLEAETVEEPLRQEDIEFLDGSGIYKPAPEGAVPEVTITKIEVEAVSEPDPYKGLTKAQLVEMLKEKAE